MDEPEDATKSLTIAPATRPISALSQFVCTPEKKPPAGYTLREAFIFLTTPLNREIWRFSLGEPGAGRFPHLYQP
jgi:hypothetical protein